MGQVCFKTPARAQTGQRIVTDETTDTTHKQSKVQRTTLARIELYATYVWGYDLHIHSVLLYLLPSTLRL